MCLILETQRVLEYTLDIPPATDKTVEEVLDALQGHIKSLRNETLRRRELLGCKQFEGESFSDFYVRLKHIAEELDVCPGASTCEETQLKMIILMGVRDEELVQKLISLDTTASLQDVVNTCRSYEATRKATSAIRAPPSQLCATSTYKKQKGHKKTAAVTPSSKPVVLCQCCARPHGPSDKCPAAESSCNNCGRRGHYSRTQKCPAVTVQCQSCSRMGHYEKFCNLKNRAQRSHHSDSTTLPSQKGKKSSCCRVGSTACQTSQPICVLLSYEGVTSKFHMLPDTGADISVVGSQHLYILQIPRSSLHLQQRC